MARKLNFCISLRGTQRKHGNGGDDCSSRDDNMDWFDYAGRPGIIPTTDKLLLA